MTRVFVWMLCGALLAACDNSGADIVLAQLNRSGKIALLCADLDQPTADIVEFRSILPLEACSSTATNLPTGVTPNFIGAVTQTQRGEVAAVNFTNDLVFDTNRAAPGFTFLTVGEQPTGLQISPVDATYSYVASFAPKSVQAVPTEAVLTGGFTLPLDEEFFEAAPADLALYEFAVVEAREAGEPYVTEVFWRYLYVALPDSGQIAEIEVLVDETTGEEMLQPARLITLETLDCDTIAQVAPDPSGVDNSYFRICPDIRTIKTVNTTLRCTDGPSDGPRPVAVEVDLGDPNDITDEVLLVADSNQPVIHRFQLTSTGAVALPAIATGTPTTETTVTPEVPAMVTDTEVSQRYLYAIDAIDASILAIDYTADSPTYGSVQPVISGITERANLEGVDSRDRIRFGQANARAIGVITPNYDPNTVAEDICDPNDADQVAFSTDPSNLRGVFLAVSLSNGLLVIMDIYDLNAPCRGGTCELGDSSADRLAAIRRHRRRFGNLPTAGVEIAGTPSLQFDTSPGTLDTDGVPGTSDGPGLDVIDCPESMVDMYGPSASLSEGLICANAQPFAQFDQRWQAIWEGLLPSSEGGLGRFSLESSTGEPGLWFIADDARFCEAGVLGETTIEMFGDGTEPFDVPYGGDRLLITGDLPLNMEDVAACNDFLDNSENIDDDPIWFPIIEAFDGEVRILDEGSETFESVASCFDQFVEYQVNTRDAYAVTGSFTGFVNRIIADETSSECVFDPARPMVANDPDTALTGRAFPTIQYTNPFVSFQIQAFPDEVVVNDTTIAILNFNIQNQAIPETFDTSRGLLSLPSSLIFSDLDQRIYFVDSVVGVERLNTFPLSLAQSFR